MATSARYFDLLREMKNAYNHRLRLVESAQQRGIKPTARLFSTTVATVRKWLRRFQQHGKPGLHGHSRGPHRIPHKASSQLENRMLACRQQIPCYGPKRLKKWFNLSCSTEPSPGIHVIPPRRRITVA